MKFSILIILSFITVGCFAQSSVEQFESALMPKKNGAEVVYSSDNHSLTLDIISNNVKPQNKPGYVTVDNKILQFVFIGNETLITKDTTAETRKKLLLGYMKYETGYIKKDLKLDYTNLTTEWVSIGNQLFLLWYYNMPDGNKSVLKQINLSTICFAHALNLNTPLTPEDKFDDNKQLLLNVAKTLKLNDFKLDFDKLYKQLNPNN